MPERIKSGLGRAVSAVRDFTVAQRTLAVLALGILIVGAAALVTFLMRPSLTPLYTGLAAEDAAAITEQLTAEGVTYELTDGGSTILVPEESVYAQRLKAAAAGLPAEEAAGGYTLLDEMGVTSSEFQQDITYKRALEGELARTIAAMGGVETASVQLALPEETVFADEELAPTASVFVETKKGETLSADQVESIVHLTSASIPGMSPTDVAVIDDEGSVLSAVGTGTTGSADKQTSDYEDRVAGQVQAMLDQVVGAGNATVAVAAEMNRASAERLEEEFTVPEGNPALNETTKTEDYTGAGGVGAGVLGPDNIAVPNGDGGESTYTSDEATRNNAVNKVTETTTIPAGEITRQTVSVALNASAAGAMDQGAISDLVAAAAGVDAERGDVVEVQVLPFNDSAAAEAEAALAAAREAEAAAQQASLVRTALIAGGLVLATLIGLVALARRRRNAEPEPVDIGELGMLDAVDDEPDLDLLGPDSEAELPAPEEDDRPAIAPPTPRFTTIDQRRAEVDALAETDPERTVEYLRELMDADHAGATR